MTDQVFLVTGASSGIGAATAKLAVEAEYRVVLCARNAERLSAFAASLGSDAQVLAVACDVTDWEQVRGAMARAERELGRIDVVFANAGQSLPTSFATERGASPEQWPGMVLANVYGPAATARAAMPALVRFGGHLVLCGSAAGRGMRPGSLYSATKWAVTGLAQAIRAECVGTGIRVTLIQPGMVDTPATVAAQVPKLDATDIARAVLYAVSQPSTVDVNEIVVRPVGQDPFR